MAIGRFLIIGCGPGGPDLLTDEARLAIRECRCLIGAARLQSLFPDFRGIRVPFGGAMTDLIARAATEAECGTVGILASGDPGVFSIARSVIDAFSIARCRVVPGISSIQVACARLGVPWTEAHIVSAHGKVPDIDAHTLAAMPVIVLLVGGEESQDWLERVFFELELTHRIHAMRDLTLPGETIEEVDARTALMWCSYARALFVLIRRES